MPTGVTKTLLDTATDAVRHFAWYFGYHAGASGPRNV